MQKQKRNESVVVLIINCALDVRRVFKETPRPLYLPGKTRYPLYKRLGGPQGRSGRVLSTENLLLPPGFGAATVQPVGVSLRYSGPHATEYISLICVFPSLELCMTQLSFSVPHSIVCSYSPIRLQNWLKEI